MKKIPGWIVVLFVIVLLISSKFVFFSKKEEKAGGNNVKGKQSPPAAVAYFVVKPVPFVNKVYATGKIGAVNHINVLPEVAGKITAIYCKEGEQVAKGTLLVKLNDDDVQAQLGKIKTQIKFSTQKLDRLKKLLDINGVSREEYDMQENELATFKAEENYLLAQLAKSSINAPFDGVVGLKNMSEGSFVNANTPLFSLVQTKPLFVEFSVPEKYGNLVKKGQAVSFSVDNLLSNKTFTALTYAIEPSVDEATKTIKARALYTGEDYFYPGSFARVYLNLSEMQDVLMIPTQCLIATIKGQKVFCSKNGLAQEVPVKIGIRTDEKVQVLEGLQAGDTVIVNGLLSVKKEAKLKLIKQVN